MKNGARSCILYYNGERGLFKSSLGGSKFFDVVGAFFSGYGQNVRADFFDASICVQEDNGNKMLRFNGIRTLTLGIVGALSFAVGLNPQDFGLNESPSSVAVAQDRQSQGRRFNRQDDQRGRQGDQRGRQGAPNNRRGNGNWSPENIIANMTQEQFNRAKNSPFASRLKEMVGEERWTQWENGNFSGEKSPEEAAAQAQAVADGKEIPPEMTDEEKLEAEALLRSGTVPQFNADGEPRYSIQTEEDYYRAAMARRDDALVSAVPLTLRFYTRYLFSKYDVNGDGILQRDEWEYRLEGAQAIDLNGDFDLTEQEVLFYLVRFAKDRTILNPNPPQYNRNRSNFVVGDQEKTVLIRPASAAPKKLDDEEAKTALLANDDGLVAAEMTEEEIKSELTEDNPALENVDDEELLDALLTDMDESSVREYAAPPQVLKGTPVWFLARDQNGDGQLTLREFAPTLSLAGVAQFGKLDADADGVITADEVRKATGNRR